MKKRSMLAFASLAVGVVASLTAPSANADSHPAAAGPAVGGVDMGASGNQIGPLNQVKDVTGELAPVLGALPY
ncbi:hypothetical protein C7C46_30850 [Streptomyces tateyamensis]|uniref:Secreted protein n=2 Tax=Streptomyces tateyamensis TaxID=565073 RepID=A0A2V4NTM4_9ACTN|nr:hypothetical protein C7C46_30850 [Streptomyces tateyamensis]